MTSPTNDDRAKHTPGPWATRINSWSRWEIFGGSGCLASVSKPDDPASPPKEWRECEANARLIAAAPDLLDLAKQYASECAECNGTGRTTNPQYTQHEVDCPDCEGIRAVVAKAEGHS